MQAIAPVPAILPCANPADLARRRFGLCVLVLVWALTWALALGYDGLRHDAVLYTLQALAHLHPRTLSADVFLAWGSQDRYTLFGPIYAACMQWLGVEPAAAALTLTGQLAVLASAFFLLRRLVSPACALLGVTVMLAVPGIYGASRVFHCLETLVTPRMLAEALVLCGLAAASSRRARLGVLLTTLAALLHPVMAIAGFASLAFLHLALPRPRQAALVALAAVVVLVMAAYTLPFGPLRRFDAQWLELVRSRSPYLFLSSWGPDDWGRVTVTFVTLWVAASVLPRGGARNLSLVALLAGVSGLALNYIAVDLLELVRFTQMQPWRWMWLPTAAAALLLPAIVVAGWQNGSAARTSVLLVLTAWVFDANPLATDVAIGAVLCTILARKLSPSAARLVFYGACGLLVIAVAARLAWNSLLLDSYYYDTALPLWVRKAASFTRDGTIPIAIAVLTVWLASRPRATPALAVLAVMATAACIVVAPTTWSRWTARAFPPSLVSRFEPWRALIPPASEVFWPESPLEASVLLERPDYLSAAQTTGLVFSRAAAMELRRRAFALAPAFPPAAFLDFDSHGAGIGPSPEQLERACRTHQFPFLVTGAHLDRPVAAELPGDAWRASKGLRLYRCADQAG